MKIQLNVRLSQSNVGTKYKSDSNHKNLEVVWVKVQYFALVFECVTNGCFFEFHDTNLSPKKKYTQDPEVDIRSSESFALESL